MLTQEKPKHATLTQPPLFSPARASHPHSDSLAKTSFVHAKFTHTKITQAPLSPTQILHNFLTYASTALIIRGMTVLITPITMRVITPSDYGKMALLTSFAQVGCAIMGLGLRQVLALEYFHTPQEKRAELITTIMMVYGIASVPLLFLALILREQISYFLFAQAIPAYLVSVSLVFIFASFFSELCYQVMRFEQQARKLTQLYLVIAIISTGATLFLLWHARTGYASILYGQFLGAIMAVSYAISHDISSGSTSYNTGSKKQAPKHPLHNFFSRPTHSRTTHNTKALPSARPECIAQPETGEASVSRGRKQAKKSWRKFCAQIPNKATVSHYLFLGLPFIPGMLCSWLLASGDRLMLARYGSLENVGIYSIADSVCQLFTILVLQPWNSSYLPYILKKYTESSSHICAQKLIIIERENQKLMWVSMAGLATLIVAGLYIFRPLLLIFLSPAYHEALNYLLLLLLGSVFLYGAHCASTFIQFHKKSGFLAFSLTIPAILNIILNSILIPRYAIYGCVIATLLSYLAYFLITLGYNQYLLTQYKKLV
jgi:O-antigen/teichoic acid export membrane protein